MQGVAVFLRAHTDDGRGALGVGRQLRGKFGLNATRRIELDDANAGHSFNWMLPVCNYPDFSSCDPGYERKRGDYPEDEGTEATRYGGQCRRTCGHSHSPYTELYAGAAFQSNEVHLISPG